jgi:hypothetical protein
MTPGVQAINVTVQSAPDVLGSILNAGVVLVAALIGLAGLWWVNTRERKDRRFEHAAEVAEQGEIQSRLALERLMAVIGNRVLELDVWLSEPTMVARNERGVVVHAEPRNRDKTISGPLDVEMQTAADLAAMASSPGDRAGALALAELLFHFKRALTIWQIRKLGEVVGDIRKWKTGDLSESDFLAELDSMKKDIVAGEKYRMETGPDHVKPLR